jgi:hypothetical protein
MVTFRKIKLAKKGKDAAMSEIKDNQEQTAKQTSGAWVLLLFVALIASVVIFAMILS